MATQLVTKVENNFTKGLITEFTGLNFPENAATDCDNCTFSLIGDVTRRLGIDSQPNGTPQTISRIGCGVNSYKWNNAGGDGLTQVVVQQVGNGVYFYKSSTTTSSLPLSTQYFSSIFLVAATGNTFDPSLECQFADGNGYLFIFHPNCDPVYCTYSSGVINSFSIEVDIRDFIGVDEPGVTVSNRPSDLTNQHTYNLINQGWIKGSPWSSLSSSAITVTVGLHNMVVLSGLAATIGDIVGIYTTVDSSPGGVFVPAGTLTMSGPVTGYSGTSLTVNVTFINATWSSSTGSSWNIIPISNGYIAAFQTATQVYPSNSDVWWYFKNSSGVFDPATTVANTTLSSGPAPKGHFITNAFAQYRSLLAGIPSLTDISTHSRPQAGCWFQGRVFYTGVNSQSIASGNALSYTWTGSIYFSQVVQTTRDFGSCYQANDPTSENLFDLLPTDGGVIVIQDSGSIYKLFPIQNGLLVFAANGVWFITGSQGIGFAANDYTVTKLSSVRSISGTSFVDVNGLPYFWNEEGIYAVQPQQGGGLAVNSITVGTILSFYNEIPFNNKLYARAAYDPVEYVIQWIYKSSPEETVVDRYSFDRILNFNVYNKAFYPYSVSTSASSINGIIYVASPGGTVASEGSVLYINSSGNQMQFAQEFDTDFVDWASFSPTDYTSYFITGYKVHGQGQKKFQLPYIYTFSRNDAYNAFFIQGLWDFATSRNTNRWSSKQFVENLISDFSVVFRRHKLRGRGLVLQLKITSVSGKPFDIIGWSILENLNTGV